MTPPYMQGVAAPKGKVLEIRTLNVSKNQPFTRNEDKTMKIYCLGDSLTEGDYGVYGKRGIANVQPLNYPYFLQQLSGATVVNCGRCGHRTTDYIHYYESGKVQLQDANIIIILLGTNGGLDPAQQTPENAAYRQLLDRCRQDAPGARIYLGTPPHVSDDPNKPHYGKALQVENGVAFVRQLAREYDLELIELALCPDFTAETEDIMQPNDGLHFGEMGYRTMAKFIFDAIKDNL